MNEHELLDNSNRLSISSLSKSSPSNIQPFQLKSAARPPLPLVDKNKPSNLSHVPCKFFKQGTCTAGANCIFSHNPDPTSESSVCKYFRKGNCKFGTKCALLHTMSPYSTSTTTSKNTQQQQQQQSISTASSSTSSTTRFLLDPFYSNNSNTIDTTSSSNDPFASSAPSLSPFLSNNVMNNSFSNQRAFLQQQQSTSSLHSIPELNRYQQEDDVNDFMLPSSLNDLLTPTELRQQQLFPMRTNNNDFFTRQFSSSWNVPFYTNTTTSSYSYDESSPPTIQSTTTAATRYQQQPINIPGNNNNRVLSDFLHHGQDFLPNKSINNISDEDGPFIMEDTPNHCIEQEPTAKNIENYSYNIF